MSTATAIAPTNTLAATRVGNRNVYRHIGMDVRSLTSIPDILASTGADFEAYGVPGEYEARDGVRRPDGTQVIVRDDTHEAVGSHKTGYEIVQYNTLVDVALETVGLAGNGAALDTVGLMKNGAQFYAVLDLGMLVIDPQGLADKLARYLLVFGSHNGTFSNMFVPRAHRLACMNELPAIRRGIRGGEIMSFAAKHTKNVMDKLATAKAALGIEALAADLFVQQAEAMMAQPATHVTVERTVSKLWKQDGTTEKAKTTAKNRMDKIMGLFDGPTCVGAVGANNWAVYQSITEYLDHHRGTTQEKRALATIVPGGSIDKQKGRALELCLN